MKPGQLVLVSGRPGTVTGRIRSSDRAETLPALYGEGEMRKLRAILREWRIEEIALIEYERDGLPVVFFALRDNLGYWRDLKANSIAVTPIHGQFEIRDFDEARPA